MNGNSWDWSYRVIDDPNPAMIPISCEIVTNICMHTEQIQVWTLAFTWLALFPSAKSQQYWLWRFLVGNLANVCMVIGNFSFEFAYVDVNVSALVL